ncbi:MAG: tail fiber domain-containing protein [Lachnospiraceae bacterium]
MAIKAGSEITLTLVVDVKATYRYYLLQSSTLTKPSKPTTYPPSAQWTDTEPDYTSGSTNSLYVVDCTLFCDDTFTYSEVSLSSSYEAAKAAYNKAVNAYSKAEQTDKEFSWLVADDYSESNVKLSSKAYEVMADNIILNGANIQLDGDTIIGEGFKLSADNIDVIDLAALNATIAGFTIEGNTLSCIVDNLDLFTDNPQLYFATGTETPSEYGYSVISSNIELYQQGATITAQMYYPYSIKSVLSSAGISLQKKNYASTQTISNSTYFDDNIESTYSSRLGINLFNDNLTIASESDIDLESDNVNISGNAVVNGAITQTSSNENNFSGNVVSNRYLKTSNGFGLQCLDANGAWRGVASLNASDAYYFGSGGIANNIYIGTMSDANDTHTINLNLRGKNVLVNLDGGGVLRPAVDAKNGLGASSYRWTNVYAVSSAILTSDRNCKTDIAALDDKYLAFFSDLIPVSFKLVDGTSGRTHIGFISQDVEEAMRKHGISDLEFAGFCKDIKTRPVIVQEQVLDQNGEELQSEIIEDEIVYDENGNPEYLYSLRYEEFIALNTAVIQKQQKELEALKETLNTILGRLEKLESVEMK